MKEIQTNIMIWCLALPLLFLSCKKDRTEDPTRPTLIFGHFYGECFGETCVEIFRIENGEIREDVVDMYPNESDFYPGDFEILLDENVEDFTLLIDAFPMELLSEDQTVLGIPDAGDWGGFYLEYQSETMHQYWLIDKMESNIPEYLHEYTDILNDRIWELSGN